MTSVTKTTRTKKPAHKLRTPRKKHVRQILAAPPTASDAKNWSSRRANGTCTLAAQPLARLPWLVHGFSTRLDTIGGKKAAPFNLGFTENDARAIVAERRRRFAAAMGAADWPLFTARQFHSDVIHIIADARVPSEPPRADALLTQVPGILLAVQTADCAPILLVDTRHRFTAAVHAGWRGTLARIAQKVLGRMHVTFGTRPADVLAAIGPSIGPCCYEVGPEVAQAFAGQFDAAKEWFAGPFDRLAYGEEPNPLPWLNLMPPGHQPPPPRVHLDLRAANRWQLLDAGVSHTRIVVSPLCTACRTELLFSYRREGAATGRLMAAIGLRP
ncbi:MAG: peptidoglycan editing factor PgeF [Candidatus Acidiferrales bacterium]